MARPPLQAVAADRARPRPVSSELILALNDLALRAIATGATSFVVGMQSGDEEMVVMSYPPAKAARSGMAAELNNQVNPGIWVDPSKL